MIISGMWFGAEKSWEPVTVLLFSLASFITSDIREIEQPDRFEEVVNKLHDSAGEIVKIHKELISLGIKKGLKNYDKSLNQ